MANKGIRDFIKDYTVEVLAGITLLVISGVFGTLRLFFPKVLQSIRQGVTTVWGFFLSPVSLPVWVVGVLTILSLLMAGMIVFMVILSRSTKDYDVPKLSEYKEDFIFDVVWRWDQLDNQSRPAGYFWCHCPVCRTPLDYSSSAMLVGMDAVSSTVFSCERCDEAITEQEGDFDDIRSKVGGRVQGKAISGEWKYLVRRSKAGRLVPIEKKRENINERCARIRRWRDAIDNVEGWHLDSSFQDTAVYSEMKPHLSKQVREKIEVPRNTLTLKPRPGIAINGESNKQLLLDEIVRIEREWGLI